MLLAISKGGDPLSGFGCLAQSCPSSDASLGGPCSPRLLCALHPPSFDACKMGMEEVHGLPGARGHSPVMCRPRLGSGLMNSFLLPGLGSAVEALAGKSTPPSPPRGAKRFPTLKTVLVAPALWEPPSLTDQSVILLQMGRDRGEATASCSAGEALATENELVAQPCYADIAKWFFGVGIFLLCVLVCFFFLMLCLCGLFWACLVPWDVVGPSCKAGLCHGNMQRCWQAQRGSGLLVFPGSRNGLIRPDSVLINQGLPLPLQQGFFAEASFDFSEPFV